MLGLGFTLKQDQATTKYTIIETNRNHEKTLTLSKSFLERRAVKEIDTSYVNMWSTTVL